MPDIRAHNCLSCGTSLPSAEKDRVACDHCGRVYQITAMTGSLHEVPVAPSAPESFTSHSVPAPRSVWPKVVAKVVALVLLVSLVTAGVFYFLQEKARDFRTIQAAALSSDGRLVAVAYGAGLGRNGSVHVWDAASGASLGAFDGLDTTWIVKWSPDGKLLATGHHDGEIGLWDASEGRRITTFGGISGYVDDLAWSPDGTRIASGDDNGVIRIWDVASGALVGTHSVHGNNVARVAWSPDGTLLASAGWDNFTRVVDAATGRQLLSAEDTNFVKALAWSPDGRVLASGGYGNVVHIYDVSGAREIYALSMHKNSVSGIAWSPDGRLLVSSGDDETMRVWDLSTGKQIQAFDLGASFEPNVMWAPDGSRVAGASKGGVCIWSTAGGAVQRLVSSDAWRTKIVGWTPDGTRVILLDLSDDAVYVWDVVSGNQLQEVRMPLLEGIRRALF